MLTKICKTCDVIKTVSEFNKNLATKDGLQYNCRDCSHQIGSLWKKKNSEHSKQTCKTWRLNNPLKTKLTAWKSNGISTNIIEYERLLSTQENRCAICNIPREQLTTDLALDHCHKTGKVRGLLCQKCNRGLGHFKDNIELIKKAINYLNKVETF